MKKVINVIINTIQYIFLFLYAIVILITITSKKNDDGSTNIFNKYQLRLVTTDSMAECELTDVSDFKIKSVPKNSLVLIKLVPNENQNDWYEQLNIGDVLTFKYVYTEQVTITHRVIDIEKKENDFTITLEGDNKSSQTLLMKQVINTSNVNSPNYVIGKVIGKSLFLGLIVNLFTNKISLIFIIIIPCLILIIIEILKVMKVINIDKIKKTKEIVEQKDAELEILREKLKQLEKNKEVV